MGKSRSTSSSGKNAEIVRPHAMTRVRTPIPPLVCTGQTGGQAFKGVDMSYGLPKSRGRNWSGQVRLYLNMSNLVEKSKA
ncbi:hypothetical protein MTR_7g106240 [Medicago truncatula]|uniref:Uncharacterized protein n=1 Tax=Medicago truncatula TaxID=3880 RepID=A0A072UEL4_MEDTR|nr:hypothetical protein MTR_7g106240 [Medicago truncatula]